MAGHFLNWDIRIECSGPIVAGEDREIVAVQKKHPWARKMRGYSSGPRCRVAELSRFGYIWNEAETFIQT